MTVTYRVCAGFEQRLDSAAARDSAGVDVTGLYADEVCLMRA